MTTKKSDKQATQDFTARVLLSAQADVTLLSESVSRLRIEIEALSKYHGVRVPPSLIPS